MTRTNKIVLAVFIICIAFITTAVSSLLVTVCADTSDTLGYLDQFTSTNWEAENGDLTIRERHNSATNRTYVELEMYGETYLMDTK